MTPNLRHFVPTLALVAALAPLPAVAQYEDESVAAFLAADANGDEHLDLDEFRAFVGTLADAGAPMSIRIRNFAAYRIAFGRVDANNDGLASPDELRAAEAQE